MGNLSKLCWLAATMAGASSAWGSADPSAPWTSVHPISSSAAPASGKPAPTIASQGVLGRDTVRRTIQLHHPAFRYCYEQELGRQPALTATVNLTFMIAADGKVTSVEDSGRDALSRCVGQTVRRIRFPALTDIMSDGSARPSKSATAVTYRFAFRPAPRDGRNRIERAREAKRGGNTELIRPEATGPKAPPVAAPSPAASAPGSSSTPKAAPVPSKQPPRIDTRHGDDPLKGIPAGDAL